MTEPWELRRLEYTRRAGRLPDVVLPPTPAKPRERRIRTKPRHLRLPHLTVELQRKIDTPMEAHAIGFKDGLCARSWVDWRMDTGELLRAWYSGWKQGRVERSRQIREAGAAFALAGSRGGYILDSYGDLRDWEQGQAEAIARKPPARDGGAKKARKRAC